MSKALSVEKLDKKYKNNDIIQDTSLNNCYYLHNNLPILQN